MAALTSEYTTSTSLTESIALISDVCSATLLLRSDFLHGIADRLKDESIHLERVANVHQIDDADLKAKVISAMRKQVQGDVSLQRESRLSMTFRDVQKVSKGLTSLLKRQGQPM